MYFKDQVVLISGAASGMGSELCRLLGQEGAMLGLIDRNEEGLASQEKALTAKGVRCVTAVADVRKRDEVKSAIAAVTDKFGPVDVLIPCAGLCGFSTVEDLEVDRLEEILQVNFNGVVYAIDAVLPEMLRRGRGQIAGIASLAALRAIPFEGAYCASKAALAAYLESLRPALRRRGVTVTTIFPGFVRTPLLDALLVKGNIEAPRDAITANVAAHRILKAIRRKQRVAFFPFMTSLLSRSSRLLPAPLYDWIMTRMAARIALPY